MKEEDKRMIERAWGKTLLLFSLMILLVGVSFAVNLVDIRISKTENELKAELIFDSEVSSYSTTTDLSLENFTLNFKDSKTLMKEKSLDVGISPVFKIEIGSNPLQISFRMIFPRLPEIKKSKNVLSLTFKRYEKKADFVFSDTDLGFVGNYIAEMMGISIIVDQQVRGLKVSMNLRNSSPEDAFMNILKTHDNLGYVILPDRTLYVSNVSDLTQKFGEKILLWKIYDFSDYSTVTKRFIRDTISNLFNMMKQSSESFIIIPPSEYQVSQISEIPTQTQLTMPEIGTFLVLLKARKETHDKFEEIISYLGKERITQTKIKLKYLNPQDLLKKSSEIASLFSLDEFEVLPETGYVNIKGKVQNVKEAISYLNQLEEDKKSQLEAQKNRVAPKRIEIFETIPVSKQIDEPFMKKIKELYPKVSMDYIDGGSKLFVVGTALEIDGIKRILEDFGYTSEPQKTEFVPVSTKYIDDLAQVIADEFSELTVQKLRSSILLLRGPESKIAEVKDFIDSLMGIFESREARIIRKIITLNPATIDNAKSLVNIVVPSLKSDSIDELGLLILEGTPEDVQEALELVEGYVVKDEDVETISVILKGLDYSKVGELLKFYGLEDKIATYYIPDANLLLMRGKTSDLAKIYREISQIDKNVFYSKKFQELESKDLETLLVDKMPQLSFDDVKKIINSMYPDISVEETTDKYILKGKPEVVEKALNYLESMREEVLSERFKVVRISENVSLETIQKVVELYSPNLKILNLSSNKIILKGDPSDITKIQEVLKDLGLVDLAAGKSIQLLKVENLDPQEATKLLKVYFPELKVDYLSKAQTFILVGTPDDVVGATALLKNFSTNYAPQVEKPQLKLENSISFNSDGTFDISVEDFTVEEVLKYVADKLGKNIMISIPMPEKLKMNSKRLSWESFLRVIEQNFGYIFNEVAGVITPKKAEEIPQPEVKKYIYRVNYNIDEVKALIEFYGGKTYVDKKNNLIIVSGITEEKKRELDQLIKEISSPVKQVEIEARVVDKSLVDDLFRSITTVLSTNEAMGGEPSITGGNGEKTVSKTTLVLGEGENVQTIEEKLSSSGLNIYTGVLSKLEYDKLMGLLLSQLGAAIDINASKDNSAGDTLSSPKIVTISGNTAEIHVGDRVPYVKKIIDENGREQVDVENIETGIRLKITPIVKPDNSIELDILAEVSDISGTRYAGPEQGDLPIISSRNATTRVIIGDGETFVIGGLTTTVKTDSVSKLPVVGDLPFIGELFKTKKKVDQKRELVIFITARVVN